MFKKNKSKIYFLIYLIAAVSVFFLFGCSSAPKPPECINSTAMKAELSWGTLIGGGQNIVYNMKMNGEIFDLLNPEKDRLAIANPDTLCNLLREVGALIIEVQILNAPADTNLFVEYKNPERDYYFRALWDPKFDNNGNHKFAELYKRLINLTQK